MHRDTEGLTVGPPVAVRVITESVREVLVASLMVRLCDDADTRNDDDVHDDVHK